MAQNIKDMIKTSSKVVPMIYAYTTPGITYHDGYIKIGYTEQDVDARIWQQTHTAGIKAKKEWQGFAAFDDGSGDTFRDTDFHAYLRKLGVMQPQDEGNEYFDPSDRNEWFHLKKSHLPCITKGACKYPHFQTCYILDYRVHTIFLENKKEPSRTRIISL